MALSPEEAKKIAYDKSVAAGEEQVAIFLKKQFGNLGILYDTKDNKIDTKIGDDEYRRMARDLIDKQAFEARTTSGGSIPITLDDLDKKIGIAQPEMKASLGVTSLTELVPTREQLSATADAVGEGVKENTGTIGFLGGATFMNALKGFFSWMMSGFSGGFAGLKQSIAQITAASMRESVSNNLTALRDDPNKKMGKLLTDDTIKNIGNEVNNSVLREAGVALPENPEAAEKETLETAKQETINSNKLAENRLKIRNKTLYPEGKPSLADTMATEMIKAKDASWKGYLGGRFVKAETRLTKAASQMAPIIADTISQRITDPNFRTADGKKLSEMDKNQYATIISDEVGKELSKREQYFDVPDAAKLSAKSDDGKTNLDLIKDKIRESLMQDGTYEQLSMASRVTDKIGEQNLARAAARHSSSSTELAMDSSFNATGGTTVNPNLLQHASPEELKRLREEAGRTSG
jgi:hypothetical protein